ncbi:hypothetical protein [Paenibacillus luteus]|uniref:hypothetical protein n=1 Tax=Paenibacillus luteus TaxID=2545753 RepID=UPI001144A695|nr:hypothetical protein [Paenibacillus luteus]
MAKGRRGKKSEYIKAVKTAEQRALKNLWRTGVVTKSQLEKHYELHGERLAKFEKSGFISIQQDLIRLDKKGIDYCNKELKLDPSYRYRSQSNHLKHDLKLTVAYLKLNPEIQETWKTEMQLYYEAKAQDNFLTFKQEMTEQHPSGHFKAVPDAAIQDPNTGLYMAFECVTKNYNEADIAQKEAFSAQYLGGIYKF